MTDNSFHTCNRRKIFKMFMIISTKNVLFYVLKSSPLIVIVFGSILLFSCGRSSMDKVTQVSKDCYYLHLSHTRTDSNPKMDSVAERIDFSRFDMLWLGGDLANLTSKDDETMMHADSVYNFGDPNTLWTLGNHDYTDVSLVSEYTNRPLYYASHKNGITFLVFDTMDSLSSILEDQLELFHNVMDTLKESSHLVILHHKLIWMYGNPILEPQALSISNVGIGDCSFCINPNNFYTEIYPELIKVLNSGIEVICIGGDLGIFSSEFEFLTPEGIHFLASGINSGASANKALVFHHDLIKRELSWKYELLVNLQ